MDQSVDAPRFWLDLLRWAMLKWGWFPYLRAGDSTYLLLLLQVGRHSTPCIDSLLCSVLCRG